jgi:hypothetical protein
MAELTVACLLLLTAAIPHRAYFMTPSNSPLNNAAADGLSSLRDRSAELLNLPGDNEIWESLKQAISQSSGFQRWQAERGDGLVGSGLDSLVRTYLRETLETLAY